MSIMGITQDISFEACIDENVKQYKAKIILNRTKWQLAGKGSWLERKLVDDEFEIKVILITKPQNKLDY